MIHVGTQDRFRDTAACLLLTPYADENLEHHLPHPFRAKVLAAVERHSDHTCAVLFRELLAATGFGQFYCLSSWLAPAPPFDWLGSRAAVLETFHLPPDLRQAWRDLSVVERWPGALTSFHGDAKLAELWQALEPEWTAIYEQCRSGLESHRVEDWLLSFWGTPTRRMMLVPNPTDPPTFGFGLTNSTEAFYLLGPPAVARQTPESERDRRFDYACGDVLSDLAVHEFGHTFLTDVREQLVAVAENTAEIGASLEVKGWFPGSYRSWRTRLEEIILRAIQAVWRTECISRESAHEFVQNQIDSFGLVVLPTIYQGLLEARQRNMTLGPAGVVAAAEAALLSTGSAQT